MDDLVGVEYLANIDFDVKNKLIMEEVEHLKRVLQVFDVNEYDCFWKLMNHAQRIDSLKSERDAMSAFTRFYRGSVEGDNFPSNIKSLRSFRA
jgi:hypothetical protein